MSKLVSRYSGNIKTYVKKACSTTWLCSNATNINPTFRVTIPHNIIPSTPLPHPYPHNRPRNILISL